MGRLRRFSPEVRECAVRMVEEGFIDDHRDVSGVESICAVLPIAPIDVSPPSRRPDPARRCARAGDACDNALAESSATSRCAASSPEAKLSTFLIEHLFASCPGGL